MRNIAIVLTAFAACACSLKDPSQTQTIEISLPNASSASARFSTPTSLSSFTCYAVNVTGPGIGLDPRMSCSTAGEGFGAFAGFVSASQSTISLQVSNGHSRQITLLGIDSANGCPDLNTVLSNRSAYASLGNVYVLAQATVDVLADTTVDMTASFAATQEPAFQDCGTSWPTSTQTAFVPGVGYALGGPTGAAGATGSGEVDVAYAITIDSQGRIVAAGGSFNPSGGQELAIWRYNTDGTPDTTFGGGSGHVISGQTGAAGATGAQEYDIGAAVQIDSNGKIVVAGSSANGTGTELAVWRFNSNGTPDTSFGTNGYVLTGSTGAAGGTGSQLYDNANALRIDSSGNYFMTGQSRNSTSGSEMALWECTPSGTLSVLAISGSTGLAGGTGSSDQDSGNDLVVDSSENIVVAGQSMNSVHGTQLAIWRFLSGGTPDTSFGGGTGHVLSSGTSGAAGATGSSELDAATAVNLDSSGNIVVAGNSTNSSLGKEVAIWRYTSSGALDTSFNGSGIAISGQTGAAGATGSSETDVAYGAKIDSSGNIVISGASDSASGGPELAIWRYTSSGSLDSSFGGAGYVLGGATGAAGAIGSSEADRGNSLIIDSSGRYVIGGASVNTSGGNELAIWRYLPNGTLNQ